MVLREKFGRLVLLQQTDSGPLGNEYRAARLGPSGFDRLVSVLRFSPAVSGHAEASKRLVEEARVVAQIHNPGLVRVLGVGRVNQSFYVSTELIEGRTVRTILALCGEEGFPFGADHVLMIASRAAAGLELLHARKDESGRALVHGLVSPSQLVVAFDGEVKIKGLGLWPALGATDLLAPGERAYLAPEQSAGNGEPRSDVFALGLVLLEALSGQPPDGGDPVARIAGARMASPGGEPAPLPKPLADLLRMALGREPALRFAGMAEMRRAIDALLFSGDFTPTTFDLAFFMHTLFRDEVERDTRAQEEARAADYREFLAEEVPKAPSPPPPFTEPVDARSPAPEATDALVSLPTEVPAPTPPEPLHPTDALPAPPSRPAPGPDASQARIQRVSREAGVRDAAARLSLGGAPARRPGMSRSLWLGLGLVVAVVLGGGVGFIYFVTQRRSAPSPAAPSAEQAAADARVRELEARIAQLEREKAEAETRAAEEAGRAVEQRAAAGGRPADPAAIAQAQQEARQRARTEQERKQQEELKRLADEKRAEEQRLAVAAAAALATPAPTPVPTPVAVTPPTPAPSSSTPLAPAIQASQAAQLSPTPIPPAGTLPTVSTPGPSAEPAVATPQAQVATPTLAPVAPAGPATTPSVRRGELVDITDPAVTPPVLLRQPRLAYPAIALAARADGVVEVKALVDEIGNVAEVAIVRSSRPGYRFEAEAERHARGRKYRPATKQGVAVRVWLRIVLNFKNTG